MTRMFGLVLAALLMTGCENRARVASDYASQWGVDGGLRDRRHTGMDFRAPEGTPVLAPADGSVFALISTGGCGLGVMLEHTNGGEEKIYSRFCHLSRNITRYGAVRRGEEIGRVGKTGTAAGVNHVHFEATEKGIAALKGEDGVFNDPKAYLKGGCFDPNAEYPDDQFFWTDPIPCQRPTK